MKTGHWISAYHLERMAEDYRWIPAERDDAGNVLTYRTTAEAHAAAQASVPAGESPAAYANIRVVKVQFDADEPGYRLKAPLPAQPAERT